ncbi:MAG: hypothetical protein AAFO58_08255 [Pseudomonadota bacterium]
MKNVFAITAAIALTSTAAFANSYFGNLDGVDIGSNVIELSLVTTDAPGMVQIETPAGEVLGMAELNEGANATVVIPLSDSIDADLIAKLIVDGAVVAEERLEAN